MSKDLVQPFYFSTFLLFKKVEQNKCQKSRAKQMSKNLAQPFVKVVLAPPFLKVEKVEKVELFFLIRFPNSITT